MLFFLVSGYAFNPPSPCLCQKHGGRTPILICFCWHSISLEPNLTVDETGFPDSFPRNNQAEAEREAEAETEEGGGGGGEGDFGNRWRRTFV